MSTTTPEMYYKDLMKIAHRGTTDAYGNWRVGTGDAWCWNSTGFDGTTSLSNQRFLWDSNTPVVNQNLADDLTAAATYGILRDLYFTDTEREYKVREVSNGSKFFELEQSPNTNDETEPWEIYSGAFGYAPQDNWDYDESDNPVSYMFDNHLYTQGRSNDQSGAVSIFCCLPNLIKDGSFGEVDASGGDQNPSGDWDSTNNDWQISRGGDHQFGTNNAAYNKTDGDDSLFQFIQYECKKGEVYQLTFYISPETGETLGAGALRVHLKTWDDGEYEATTGANDAYVDDTHAPWTNGSVASGGAWQTIEFTADRDAPGMYLEFGGDQSEVGASNLMYLECVYLCKKETADYLILGNTDISQGTVTVEGYYYYPDLYDRAAAGANALSAAATLVNAQTIDRINSIFAFSASASYPVYKIEITPPAAVPMKLGKVMITKQWDWQDNPNPPFDPDAQRVKRLKTEAVGGAKESLRQATIDLVAGTISPLHTDDITEWRTWWDDYGSYGWPFWWRSTSTDDLKFLIADMNDFSMAYNPKLRQTTFRFEEQK